MMIEYRMLGRTDVRVPIVGQGTWGIGGGMRADHSKDPDHIEALRYGLDLGMVLVDTAEMYGAGHSEEVVAAAIGDRRGEVFLATKVSPQHFAYQDVLISAKASLKRLRIRQIDLYQLHWPNRNIPISNTMRAMEKLVQDGVVKYIGVSNFSVKQFDEAQQALSREQIVSNQVEYSLLDRSPERDGTLQQCQRDRVTLIAYSPLAQGRILSDKKGPSKILDDIAGRAGKTRSQVALNWLIQNESVIIIPKAGDKSHVSENAGVSGWRLNRYDNEELGRAFE